MLTRIDRYLIREVVLTFSATVVVLLGIMMVSRLAKFLSRAAAGDLAEQAIWLLLGLQAIRYLIVLIPVAFLLGVMLALGRLYRDNEMTALTACGAGPGLVYRPLYLLALPLALITGVLSLYVAPKAMELAGEVQNQARQEAELSVIRPGTFRELAGGQYVVYVEAISPDGQELERIFVQNRLPEGLAVTTGLRGRQRVDPDTGARYIVLEQGHRYEGQPGQGDYQSAQFHQLQVRLDLPPAEVARLRGEATASDVLWQRANPEDLAELHARLSGPVSLLLIALLAPPLARARPREGRYGRLVAGVLVYAIYLNLLGVGQAWIEGRILPPAVGLWWVHALLGGVALVLWYLAYGRGIKAYRRFRRDRRARPWEAGA